MISILIPIYNWDVTKLVSDLYLQAELTGKAFEFILIDDASEDSFKILNRKVKDYSNLQYIELDKNVGRSMIRNILAELSKYQHMIFMDCDSQVVTNNYLNNYLEFCNGETVVCGGRAYLPTKPIDAKFMLRWKYGINRESTNAEKRNIYSNRSFMTNNFLISKSIFDKITFDEKLTGYGHEDTLFGLQLMKNNISIKHTDNQLFHIGLETAEEFLEKTNQGLNNLLILNKYEDLAIDLVENVKLLRTFVKFKRFGMIKLTASLFKVFRKTIQKNLTSNNPSLLFFDFYKLGYLCTTYSKK